MNPNYIESLNEPFISPPSVGSVKEPATSAVSVFASESRSQVAVEGRENPERTSQLNKSEIWGQLLLKCASRALSVAAGALALVGVLAGALTPVGWAAIGLLAVALILLAVRHASMSANRQVTDTKMEIFRTVAIAGTIASAGASFVIAGGAFFGTLLIESIARNVAEKAKNNASILDTSMHAVSSHHARGQQPTQGELEDQVQEQRNAASQDWQKDF